LVADTDEIPEHTAGLVTLIDVAHRQGDWNSRLCSSPDGKTGMFSAHAGFGRCRRAFRGASTGLRRDYPGASASLCQPRQGSVVVGTADAQPGIAVFFCARSRRELIDWRCTDPTPSFSAPVKRRWTVRCTAGRRRPRGAAGKHPLLVTGAPATGSPTTSTAWGRVEEVSGVGESAMSLIDFGSSGRVKLMHNHAPVAKL